MANAKKLGQLPPDGKCSVCSEPVSEETGKCEGCGAVYGELHRCPHCRTIADIEESEALRFRCKICGGPRVIVDDPNIPREYTENAALKLARKAHTRRTAWQLGSAIVAGFGVVALLVALATLAVVSPGLALTTLTLLMVAAPFVFAGVGFRKAKSAAAERDTALDRAWTSVAREIVTTHPTELSAKQLSKLMRIDVSQAELVLAQVSVDDFVRSRVDDVPTSRKRLADPDPVDATALDSEEADAAQEAEQAKVAKASAEPHN